MQSKLSQTLARGAKSRVPIKSWTKYVPDIEPGAVKQLQNLSSLPIVHGHIAVMPDVHLGIGATIGSVVPTVNAIIPSAVGVDIGCGMYATRTSMNAKDLPDNLNKLRTAIESFVPHGMTKGRDRGSWSNIPTRNVQAWKRELEKDFEKLCEMQPTLEKTNNVNQLGTLGTGNHFIEMCLDEQEQVWLMLHSGSRGVGNRIGSLYIELAKKDLIRNHSMADLPDKELAYLSEGTKHFDEYVFGVNWAQRYAALNRKIMMMQVIDAIKSTKQLPTFTTDETAVNCHHNYVQKETHYGKEVFLTRKGAVRAGKGELGIIPGSMGERSFIVRGLGNPESYESCSHGAGRIMSRAEAKRKFTIEHHLERTKNVECRKDAGVIDETPGCYKDIEDVMKSQSDLVEIVHTLKQVLCVKG
jgi:tRNA-splicing ligase RtcB